MIFMKLPRKEAMLGDENMTVDVVNLAQVERVTPDADQIHLHFFSGKVMTYEHPIELFHQRLSRMLTGGVPPTAPVKPIAVKPVAPILKTTATKKKTAKKKVAKKKKATKKKQGKIS